MNSVFLLLAAGTLVITALTHSIFGELKLIQPILKLDAPIIKRQLVRQVLRFAWHLTSGLWLVLALTLAVTALSGGPADRLFIAATGVLHFGVGLFDGILTRGRHIGWPLLTLIGVFCLLALL